MPSRKDKTAKGKRLPYSLLGSDTSRGDFSLIDITALALVFIGLQVFSGAFPGTPINDDWLYARILEEFVRTGRFIPLGWIGMNQLTQTLLAYPLAKAFGTGWSVLHLFTLAVGAGVLALTLVWMRQHGASRPTAFALALAWMANPIFAGLSGSFMTDVPFLGLLLLSFVLAMHLLKQEKSLLALALFILSVIAAMLLRQPALLLAIAFAMACFDRKRGWANIRLVVPILCALLAQFLFDRWISETGADFEMRRLLGARLTNHLQRLWHGDLEIWKFVADNAVDFPSCVAMLMIPLLPFWYQGLKKYWSEGAPRERRGIIGAFACGCLIVALAGRPPFRTHNSIVSIGLGPLTLRDGMMALSPSRLQGPVAFWAVIWILTALTAGVALAAWAGYLQKEKAWRQPALRMLLIFMVLYSAPFILTDFFDRYTLPVLFCLTAVLPKMNRQARDKIPVFSWIWLAAWVALATLAAHDYQAWQHARWRAGQELLAQGIDPRRIDGGYEFNGFYLGGRVKPSPGKSWWWVVDDEYLIAFSAQPFPGYQVSSVYKVARLLPTTPKQVLVLRRKEPS